MLPTPDQNANPRSSNRRPLLLILVILITSATSGWLGGHYGETRNLSQYSGPRVAHGQTITAGQFTAGLWGLFPGILIGTILGLVFSLTRSPTHAPTTRYGAIAGGIVGFIAGFISGTQHSGWPACWVGLAVSCVIGVICYMARD